MNIGPVIVAAEYGETAVVCFYVLVFTFNFGGNLLLSLREVPSVCKLWLTTILLAVQTHWHRWVHQHLS